MRRRHITRRAFMRQGAAGLLASAFRTDIARADGGGRDAGNQWPGRIVSISWGPWIKGGMVSPEVQRQFDQRGIALIPPEVGRRRLDEELSHGRKGQVEVLIGGGWAAMTASMGDSRIAPTLPLLAEGSTLSKTAAGVVEVSYTLDPARDLYLRDHRLDGLPVLPLAMAMELMVEAVLAGWPD